MGDFNDDPFDKSIKKVLNLKKDKRYWNKRYV